MTCGSTWELNRGEKGLCQTYSWGNVISWRNSSVYSIMFKDLKWLQCPLIPWTCFSRIRHSHHRDKLRQVQLTLQWQSVTDSLLAPSLVFLGSTVVTVHSLNWKDVATRKDDNVFDVFCWCPSITFKCLGCRKGTEIKEHIIVPVAQYRFY